MILVTVCRSRFHRFTAFAAALAMVLTPLLDGLAYAAAAPLECSASNADSDAVIQMRDALANGNSANHAFKRVSVIADAPPLSPEPSARLSGPISSGPASIAKPARIANRLRAMKQLGRMPLVFVENRGQAAPEVEFYTHLESATVGLTNDGLLFDLTRQLPQPADHGNAASRTLGAPASYQRARIHQRLVDPNRSAQLEADLQTPGEFNYLIGSNPARWHRHLKSYRMLVWRDVWRGTNLRLYGRDGGLEQAFVVSPQGDPARIHFALSGAKALSIDRDGSLAIDTAAGTLRERKPLAYQDIAGKRVAIAASFRLDGRGGYGFELGNYDRGRPLIIDPALIFSTYLGGVHDDAGLDIAADPTGNVYVSGGTASQNFPVSANAYQPDRSNIGTYTYDAFVTKLAPDGTLLYSTFIGGSNDDYGYAIAIDSDGNAYVGGQTLSADFPTTAGAFQTTFNNCIEGFISKLSPDGSNLIFSTFLGGPSGTPCGNESGDNIVAGVALDANNDVVAVGPTGSQDFPTTPGAFQTTMPERADTRTFASFVTELKNDGSALIYSTFLGGNTYDWANGVAVDTTTGKAYVTGFTQSTNFPTTKGAFQTSFQGGSGSYDGNTFATGTDGFLAVVDANGSGLSCATYLGGAGNDFGQKVKLGTDGNVYLAGSTNSNPFPTTNGAFLTTNPNPSGFSDTLVKMTPNCKSEIYATYVAPENNDNGWFGFSGVADYGFIGLAIDSENHAFIGSDTPDQNFPVTSDAAQSKFAGGETDAYLAEFNAAGSALIYGTYLGGSDNEGINSAALDAFGNVYVTGATNSPDFKLTPNAFQSTFGGTTGQSVDGFDAFVASFGTGTIGSVYPASGGNGGSVTLTISGAGFETGAQPHLVRGKKSLDAALITMSPDATAISATFDLTGAATGAYTVVVDNPDGSSVTSATPFTVQSGGASNVWVNVTGRSKIRVNTPSNFNITVGNSGNLDAYWVTVYVAFPDTATFQLGFTLNQLPSVGGVDPNSAPVSADTNGQTLIPLVLPIVPAGGSTTFPIQITDPNTGDVLDISAIATTPWFESINQVNAAVGQTMSADTRASGSVAGTIAAGFSLPPGLAGCLTALGMLGLSAWPGFGALKGAPAALEGAFLTTFGKMNYGVLGASGVVPGYSQTAFNLGMAATAAVALGVLAPELAIPAGALSAAIGLYQFANGGGANNCGQFGGWARALLPSGGVGAIDPNDKTGPSGAGTGQWLPANTRMSYTVSFENEPSATAPAQEVVITDQLDPTKVNLSTLSLNSLGFGNTLLTPPSGSTSYNTVVDFGPSASVEDLLVDVQGSLDPTTGLLKWTFQSIDASTGLPPDDPEAGFLPPDTSPPGGDGFVSYSVLPKSGIAEGTQITNMAVVVFDQNASINTPVWTNTVAAPVRTALKITPAKLAFPATLPGDTSKPVSVTILNPNKKSASPIVIENVMLTGNFVTQSVNNCVGTLLTPSQSCTFSVVFAPDATSPVTAGKLTITDNASGSPQKRALSGKLKKAAK